VNGSISTADVADRLEAEDLARARWYSFFSRWFLAPPDQQAIDLFVQPADRFRCTHPASDPLSEPESVAAAVPPLPSSSVPVADSPESRLESAWLAFTGAVAAASLESIRAAYDDTFISVGEAPVSLHASVYLTGFANERPLAEVRQWLASQGIRASRAGLLTEDHLGLLCEVMAWLIIERGDTEPAAADASQHFLFQRFIAPVSEEFRQRLADAPDAGVYRELGGLFSAFSAIERQAFDIDK
jgi:TorA maturation chaperone TorD